MRKVIVLAIFILIIFWFIGWKSVRYDKADKEIGKTIKFTEPMMYMTNIPDLFAGEFIAKKYGALIWNSQAWKDFISRFPQINTHEISCNEIFLVKDAFYIERHGILKSFGPDLKYFVLTSNIYNKSVIEGGAYAIYSINSGVNNNECFTKDK